MGLEQQQQKKQLPLQTAIFRSSWLDFIASEFTSSKRIDFPAELISINTAERDIGRRKKKKTCVIIITIIINILSQISMAVVSRFLPRRHGCCCRHRRPLSMRFEII